MATGAESKRSGSRTSGKKSTTTRAGKSKAGAKTATKAGTKRATKKETKTVSKAKRAPKRAGGTSKKSGVEEPYSGPPRVRIPIQDPHPKRRRRAKRASEKHPHFGLPNDALVEMWYLMVLARKTSERWFVLNRQGRAPFVITGQGQEAAQVGTAAALIPGKDWVMPYYRDIGVVLTLGMTVDELMLNVFAKASEPTSGGRQMPTHWSNRELRIPTQSSTVTTQVPIAAGLAWASKLRGEDAVAVAYLGEGATSQGDFHEGLNFAAVKKLPLIVVVENNGYAITETQEKEMAIRDVADRAQGYGVPGIVVDGNDVLMVYRTMQQAVQEARMGGGPTLIEAKTYRTVPHSSDDDDRRYRPRAELEMWLKRDPIDRFRKQLVTAEIFSEEHAEQLLAEADDEVRQAQERAEVAAEPDPATLLDHVFGGA